MILSMHVCWQINRHAGVMHEAFSRYILLLEPDLLPYFNINEFFLNIEFFLYFQYYAVGLKSAVMFTEDKY